MISMRQKNLRSISRQWIKLWDKLNEIDVRRMALGVKLLSQMKRAGVIHVPLPDGRSILHATSKQRRPSKHDLVDFLGERKGQKLWESIPEKISQYLSVVKIGRG